MITSAPCSRQNSAVNPAHAVTENVVPLRGKFPAQLVRSFRWGGGGLLFGVDSHEHGDPREKLPGPLDDVEVSGCYGVEGAGIDGMLLSRPAAAAGVQLALAGGG